MVKVRLPIPREVALQLSRVNGRLEFEGTLLRATIRTNNAPPAKVLPADRLLVTVWLPEHLVARFKAAAVNRRETLAQFASALIHRAVQDVALTSEDFRQIAAEMRAAGRYGNSHNAEA
jgi:hypothetical protein